MIARLTGLLEALDAERGAVLLEVGEVGYEVLVPGYAISDLSAKIGQMVTLHCWQYVEGSAVGGNLVPRLIGFPALGDKAFFLRFVSVKGIGIRKALRAMAQRPERIAAYIEEADDKMLATLPEIGKRTAQQIIAELKGKMEAFAMAAGATQGRRTLGGIEREALEVLLQLGERREEAEEWISQVQRSEAPAGSADALVQAVYRVKAGVMA